ncbi:hypothetical protein AAU61_17195 [Desulfocarbo indianensis]|nr:hypothetical protein AAU61_17195 [Desulfocarbo indianensis]
MIMLRILGGRLIPILFIITLLAASQAVAAEKEEASFFDQFSPIEVHGFFEMRAGYRTQNDPHEKDRSVMESRLQVELFTYTDWAEFKYKGDAWLDGIKEGVEYDTREAWVFTRPTSFMDIKIGRQILTWGTGDLVFLNDMFPKDWQSYFIGRDKEYLKAPSDAAKVSFFTEIGNLDLVYTPKFDPDRYITGAYISYWDGRQKNIVGQDHQVVANTPDEWFGDDEFALRIYKNINNYELALYGYHGFWKRPGGETPGGVAIFPRLNVYGASARGQLGHGIGNIEVAYYQSVDDEDGYNPRIHNSEIRYLAGYAQDLAKDFNASLQYYIEHMLDYDAYLDGLSGGRAKDRARHVVTLMLTKLLLNQNLELSLASYFSPSDGDAYLRPIAHYKYTDKTILELGANIFWGEESHTFFGQFENNTNVYAAIRYCF